MSYCREFDDYDDILILLNMIIMLSESNCKNWDSWAWVAKVSWLHK